MGKLFNLLLYFTFAVNLISLCYSEVLGNRLCADPNCQKVISKAKTLRDYPADTREKISFKASQTADVYSKPENPKDTLWEIQIGDQRGFAPKQLLQEYKILAQKSDKFTVPYKSARQEKRENEGKLNLQSSMSTDAIETSTTAPLLNEPKKVVVSGENNENSTEKPSTTPMQNDGDIYDGTKLPLEAVEEGTREENGKIEIDKNKKDNVEKTNSKENSVVKTPVSSVVDVLGLSSSVLTPSQSKPLMHADLEQKTASSEESQNNTETKPEDKIESEKGNSTREQDKVNSTNADSTLENSDYLNNDKKAERNSVQNLNVEGENLDAIRKNIFNNNEDNKGQETIGDNDMDKKNETVDQGINEELQTTEKDEVHRSGGKNSTTLESEARGENMKSEESKVDKEQTRVKETSSITKDVFNNQTLETNTKTLETNTKTPAQESPITLGSDFKADNSAAELNTTSSQDKSSTESPITLGSDFKAGNSAAELNTTSSQDKSSTETDNELPSKELPSKSDESEKENDTNVNEKDIGVGNSEELNSTDSKDELPPIINDTDTNNGRSESLSTGVKNEERTVITKEDKNVEREKTPENTELNSTNSTIDDRQPEVDSSHHSYLPSIDDGSKKVKDTDDKEKEFGKENSPAGLQIGTNVADHLKLSSTGGESEEDKNLNEKKKDVEKENSSTELNSSDSSERLAVSDGNKTNSVHHPDLPFTGEESGKVNDMEKDENDPRNSADQTEISSTKQQMDESDNLKHSGTEEVNSNKNPQFESEGNVDQKKGNEEGTYMVEQSEKSQPDHVQNSSNEAQSEEVNPGQQEISQNMERNLETKLEKEQEIESNIVSENPYKDSYVVKNDYEERTHQTDGSNQQVVGEGQVREVGHESFDGNLQKDAPENPGISGEDKITTEKVKNNWFFSNMFETVNTFWSTISKDEHKMEEKFDDDLDKILFSDTIRKNVEAESVQEPLPEDGYCEKVTPNSCPSESSKHHNVFVPHINSLEMCSSEKDFFSSLSDKVLEMVDLLACLLITAITALLFAFGYYCICHSRKEGALLSKLNIVERSLLASTKEAAILKHDLIETRNKLASIEDNSFGSNDMVMALKKELQDSEEMKLRLQEQVISLEKELENAAEAGLELNKIVSELLNNQSGDDSIISSVEELQKQLNEQQNTILQINTTLAEKSRENSELQLILNNQAAKFQEEFQALKQQNEDLENDKILLQAKLEESKQSLQQELSKATEEKRAELLAVGKEMSMLKEKFDEVHKKLQSSEARVQVLEECLNGVKNNAKFNIKDLIDAVNLKTEFLAIKRERDSLKERLEGEMDARKLLEDHVKIISEEVSNLKQEYNQSEKEKVEAQTRLEVLSSYFKEKETQLQKELSLKEAMWLKQQGETSSTVERVRLMQDEIQALKSQNDSLRAEIEAQAATHKAQIANLENRAHETWLAARKSERKLEEAQSEATALRRKLTSIAGNPSTGDTNQQNRLQNTIDGLANDVNNAPSPVHMEAPGSPLLGGLPPPLPFLPPPPFIAHPHPFMSMPPPFMPPGEMRPPPLGRLMSPPPPPPPDRYSPSIVDERDRYSPANGRYSPDSRYNYNTDIMSNYDTETDFSPPPSPGTRLGGGNGGGYSSRERERERSRGYKAFSPPRSNNSDRNKKSKGILSSGSADSYDSRKSKGKGKV